MTKAAIIEALRDLGDNDHFELSDICLSYVPKIRRICGKRQAYMPYYCNREPGHTGDCYCPCKNVEFTPDSDE